MNATTTSGVVYAPVPGNDIIQPPANQADQPAESVKGIFVKRTKPLRHICCTPDTHHNQGSNKTVVHYEISGHKANKTMTNPLQAPGVRETPGLLPFLEWLKQNHTETLYNCLAHYLVYNTTHFAETRCQLPDPENPHSVFEAVARQLFQDR